MFIWHPTVCVSAGVTHFNFDNLLKISRSTGERRDLLSGVTLSGSTCMKKKIKFYLMVSIIIICFCFFFRASTRCSIPCLSLANIRDFCYFSPKIFLFTIKIQMQSHILCWWCVFFRFLHGYSKRILLVKGFHNTL